MRHRLFLIYLLVLLCHPLSAERFTLKTGKQLVGTIVAQTDELLLVQTRDGIRYQLLRSDVLLIDTNETADTVSQSVRQTDEFRPVAVRLSVSGGVAACRDEKASGMFAADLQLGSRRIGDQPVFLGGSVGYTGMFGHPVAHFIPLQAVVSFPLPLHTARGAGAETGISLGYGLATRKGYSGLAGSVTAGYRFPLSGQTHLIAGACVRFQQTHRDHIETLDGNNYTHAVGQVIWLVGANLSLQF